MIPKTAKFGQRFKINFHTKRYIVSGVDKYGCYKSNGYNDLSSVNNRVWDSIQEKLRYLVFYDKETNTKIYLGCTPSYKNYEKLMKKARYRIPKRE